MTCWGKYRYLISFWVQLFLTFSDLKVTQCLYEDQVSKFDWRQQYIGKVKFTFADPSIAGIHKFIVATEENVLACLSTRTGSIVWRQILEKGAGGNIDALSEDGDLITVSGSGQFIRSWDHNTGVLQWETPFPHLQKDSFSQFKINSQSKEVIKVEIIPNSHVKLSVYSFTRASLKTSDIIEAKWIDLNTKCDFISSNFYACIDNNKKTLHLLSIKNGGQFMDLSLKNSGITVEDHIKTLHITSIPYQGMSDKPVFGLQLDEFLVLFRIQPPGIEILKIIPYIQKITSAVVDNKLVLFLLTHTNGKESVKAIDSTTLEEVEPLEGTFNLPEDRGKLEQFFVFLYTKKDHGISYKLLLLSEDHSILIIHQQGRMIWSREEALSSIVSSEILDLPLSETDASIEQEFGHPDAGLISMLMTRLKSQVFLLQTYLLNKLIGFKGNVNSIGDSKIISLTRDNFGLHKIIVILTKPGKAFGIDNLSGLIVWSHYEKDLKPIIVGDEVKLPLFVQRTTAHFPYQPICTTVGNYRQSDHKSLIYSFNPITGKTVETKILPYNFLQVMQTGNVNKYYLRNIILLDSEMKVHTYPDPVHTLDKEKHYVFTATAIGYLTGYLLTNTKENHLEAVETWKVHLPQNIIEVSTKKLLEHVHSQGRVMGDRSVLYKYLNPNLAAVFTEGSEPGQKTFCNIYLIDTVTGLIVYSASHKRCKKPINVVHSENWVVYSYYNDKSRRIEMSSIELFEGIYQSNTTAFSSFAPPPLPLVEHQTFIFSSAVEAMSDTITERGMTSKHILIALPSGGILELPKSFLDPRRPINPLPEHREEGLIPYIPELPIMSEGIINYNQSIMRVKGIVTAASGLESTCLVFVYGLDMFYTRVTPSKTFDILKDDFDHYLISVVLLGLLILSYTTKRLAARKTLRAAWK